MLEINKIHLGDNLKLMHEIEDGSIDMIFTDPPYGISMKTNLHTIKGGLGGRWHGDFEKHGVIGDRGFDQEAWLDIAIPKLRQGGNIVIFNDWKNLGDIAKKLESMKCKPRRCLIWEKTSCAPFNRDIMFVNAVEFMIWSTKGKKWTFNRQHPSFERGIFLDNINKPGSVYPTQKPPKIVSEILTLLSNEGDLILDPFSGSGSISLGCKKLNRNFIGIEINEDGYNKSLHRLEIMK